jgi:hypothetical protein
LKAAGIQSFAVQKNRTRAGFDLILGSHDSAMETNVQRFRFNGVREERIECADIEWDDENGNRIDPPRITMRPCR